jgi:hypothetical protein
MVDLVRAKTMDMGDIRRLLEALPIEAKEELIAESLNELPAESKAKILQRQMGESGLVVVMSGSNCAVNSELTFNIQNSPSTIDYAAIIEAVVARRRKDRKE